MSERAVLHTPPGNAGQPHPFGGTTASVASLCMVSCALVLGQGLPSTCVLYLSLTHTHRYPTLNAEAEDREALAAPVADCVFFAGK